MKIQEILCEQASLGPTPEDAQALWIKNYGEEMAERVFYNIKNELLFTVSDLCSIRSSACDTKDRLEAMSRTEFARWVLTYFTDALEQNGWPEAHSEGIAQVIRDRVQQPLLNKQSLLEATGEQPTAISLTRLGKFHKGQDPLAALVPEREHAVYALHPDKWESTFYSLTNKDLDKLRFYGPKKIAIPPGTLVGDMAIANMFYRAKTEDEQQKYAQMYKDSLRPYPVDVSEYRMPELLIPRFARAINPALQGLEDRRAKFVEYVKQLRTDTNEATRAVIYTHPDTLGASLNDPSEHDEPVVMLPVSRVQVLEPDSKFADPKYSKNLKRIQRALQSGQQLPPITVRELGQGYQVIDGHHRFKAYRLAGATTVPARIVKPENIRVIDQPWSKDLPPVAESQRHDREWVDAVDRHVRLRAMATRDGDEAKFDFHNAAIKKLYGNDNLPVTPDGIFNDDPGGIEIDETSGHDYMAGHCHVMALALKQLHPDWQIRAHVGWDDDAEDDDNYRVDHVYIVAPDGSAYDCRGRFDNEQSLVGPDTTGGIETQFVDYSLAHIKQDIQRGELQAFSRSDLLQATKLAKQLDENFADGRVKGRSRPGRVKRAGASCKGSVSDLRARAKKYGGERGKMYQWCLNMKSGKKK